MKCPHCGRPVSKAYIAANLGHAGGTETAKRGPEYFRQLQAMRKTKKGGFWKPPKDKPEDKQ